MAKTHHLVGVQAITDAAWDEIDPIVRLKQMTDARNLLDIKIEEAVIEARTTDRWRGQHFDHVPGRHTETQQVNGFGIASWEDVGRALGVSRQSAHRKYAHLID